MSYLLDTCVLSETVRPRPSPAVLAWLEAQDELALCLSVLTIGEIHKGVAKLPPGDRRTRLAEWLEGALIPRFGTRILPVDTAVAAAWGRISADGERSGAPIPVVDGLIAATARVHGLTVVTRNTSDFADAGVPILDPWAEP